MFNTEATHNFINEQKAKRLKLHHVLEIGKVKVVNSEAQSIKGIAKDILIKIDE